MDHDWLHWRIKLASLAGAGVVFFQTWSPSQADEEYSSEQLGKTVVFCLSRHVLVTTSSQFSITFFTNICTEWSWFVQLLYTGLYIYMTIFGILASAFCAVLLTGLSFSRSCCVGWLGVFSPYACSDVIQTNTCLENKWIVFMYLKINFNFNIVFLKGLAS